MGTVLKDSEVMAGHKAVCPEGSLCAVYTPIPYWICGVDMVDLYSENRIKALNKQVRLEVTADDSRYNRIVSAIKGIAHAGRIVLALRPTR